VKNTLVPYATTNCMSETAKSELLRMEAVKNTYLVCGGFFAVLAKIYIQKFQTAYTHISIISKQQLIQS